MKAQLPTAAVVAALCAAALLAPPLAAAEGGTPRIRQLVVFEDGPALERSVRAKRTQVEVDGRSCSVAAATPLAVLARSGPERMRLVDYGMCSRRPADGSGLFVKAMGGEVNGGLDGWVYKVGTRLGTAGAADPAGPFGDGRLRRGQRVVWFYCVFDAGSCQRSLVVRPTVTGREVSVTVTGYDDVGAGAPVARARVVAQRDGKRVGAPGVTDADGRATLTLPRGELVLHARRAGMIRSFSVPVSIR